MNAQELDFSQCENEPIHIPGSIQPHGVLFALDPALQSIAWASANTMEMLGLRAQDLFEGTFSDFIGENAVSRLRDALGSAGSRRIGPISVRVAGRDFDGIVHRMGPFAIVELESPGTDDVPLDLFSNVEQALERLSRAVPGPGVWQAVAEEVQRVTQFDRVMVYLFHPDDHGEVIAEVRAHEDIESYLHLHYPATDISVRARKLYKLNWLRLIVDIAATPAALIASPSLRNGQPLDLSHAVLRSVAPVHLQYLHNMGVRASMSISLVVQDRLWGLIACHHRTPRHLPYRTRSWCELLARILSWEIELTEWSDDAGERARVSNTIAALVRGTLETEDLLDALTTRKPSVLDLVNASGAAVVWNGRCKVIGSAPSESDIIAMVDWLVNNHESHVFATDRLAEQWPGAKPLAPLAAGLLALRVANGPVILWFRPEHARTVAWGGDPTKPAIMNPTTGAIGPRNSFQIWKNSVRNRSALWQAWEIDAAEALERPVIKAVLRRIEQIEQQNRELHDALEARDLFLAMASHELRTPLSALKLQLEGLTRVAERDPNAVLSASRLVPRLEILSRQTTRLSRIMDEILDAVRLSAGRFDVTPAATDLGEVVLQLVDRERQEITRQGCTLVLHIEHGIRGPWDRFRLGQVVGNLLSNAYRYGAGKPITITVTRTDGAAVLRVRDEGIGIPAESQELIFERFQRAVPAAHYQGLGLGLWIVREIVSFMGGHIDVNSAPGKGAEFVVTLPFVPNPENDA